MKLYTILLQKTKSASVLKDTERDFGVVCTAIDLPSSDLKDLPSNDWADEEGDDVYIPQNAHLKSSKITISAGYKGLVSEWETKMDMFLDYLTGYDGNGCELLLFMPYHNVGRVCRLVRSSPPKPSIQHGEIILEFELEFAIDNPRDRVIPEKNIGGDITSLTRKNR